MKEAKIIMVMVIMVVAKEIVHQTMKEHPKFKKKKMKSVGILTM